MDEIGQDFAGKVNPAIKGSAWVCGDIHGELLVLQVALKDTLDYRKRDARLSDTKVVDAHVILLGDIGLGFPDDPTGEEFVRKLDKLAGMFKATVYLLRGNHDNPDVWEGDLPGRCRELYPNVVFLHDGPMSINGRMFMVVGGAASADVDYREPGRDWWAGECIRMQRPLRTIGYSGYYGILSHTGPRPGLINPDLPPMFMGAKDAIDREQAVLMAIGNTVLPEVWYHGHYHRNNMESRYFCNLDVVDDGDHLVKSCRKCTCTCLDIGAATPIL